MPEKDLARIEKQFGELGSRDAEEGFVRAFEGYLRNGSAPSKPLGQVFGRYEGWLSGIYGKVKRSPAREELHPEVQGVFDRMLVRERAKSAEARARKKQAAAKKEASQPST